MGERPNNGHDPWDLDQLRLPVELVGNLSTRPRPPRHRPGDPFIKGPIPYSWVASACRLPGSGLAVAMACRFLCGRYRGRNRWGLNAIARGLRISADSARRGLHAAELAGLLAVDREPGCKLSVSILGLPGSGPGLEPTNTPRPLYGPIPWSWWLPASRLPGKALHVGAACWLLAGWERSARFELGAEAGAGLGLSRSALGRGLAELEKAGLVSVDRLPGRSPFVTIRDVRQSPKAGMILPNA
jgi:DNA-binding transcriptional ArsR family regulator